MSEERITIEQFDEEVQRLTDEYLTATKSSLKTLYEGLEAVSKKIPDDHPQGYLANAVIKRAFVRSMKAIEEFRLGLEDELTGNG